MKTETKTKVIYALSIALIIETFSFINVGVYLWRWKPAEQRAMVRGAQLQKQIIVNNLIAEVKQNGQIVISTPQGQMVLVVKEKENVNLRKKGK